MGHRMMIVLDCLVLFGGYRQNKEFGEIWRFNLTSHYWIEQELHYSITTHPTKRYDHTFVYRDSTELFYIYGGRTSRSETGITRPDYKINDLWKYELLWCPNDCSGRGECVFGYCYCGVDYYGYDCQEDMCPASKCWYNKETLQQECKFCNNRGDCKDGVCRCNDGYSGPECTEIFCEYDCNGRGNCTERGECIQYSFEYNTLTFEGGAHVFETSTNETVIHTGAPGTTTYVRIPVQRLVSELAGIKLNYRYQTLSAPLPGQGPIINYYIYHKEGHSVLKTQFGTTGSLDDYYRDQKPDLWSKEMSFEYDQMNVYVSDMKTIDIVLEIENQQRYAYIMPQVRYELCFLTKTKQDLQCACEDGWWGRLCEKKWCECSGHGSCKAINGSCECDSTPDGMWIGHNCSIFRSTSNGHSTKPSMFGLGFVLLIGLWFTLQID